MLTPADGHVHSEWSWDAHQGSMLLSCEQATRLGLPGIAFTEHLDYTVWTVSQEGLASVPNDHPVSTHSDGAGRVSPPAFDAVGYLEAIDRCRNRFPDLTILSGLELGEPHRHMDNVGAVLAAGTFDRILGSVHSLPNRDEFQEPGDLMTHRDAEQVVRDYLAEVLTLLTSSAVFSVLAHVDYPLRAWPHEQRPLTLGSFEGDFREVLGTAAQHGLALELNTVVPMNASILDWRRDEGGEAVTFGSDAHEPSRVAHAFAGAATLAEQAGFRVSRNPLEPWRRA